MIFPRPQKTLLQKTAGFDKVAPFFPAIRLTHRGNIAKEIMMTHPHEITDAVSAARTFDFRTLPGPRLRWVRCVLQVPSNRGILRRGFSLEIHVFAGRIISGCARYQSPQAPVPEASNVEERRVHSPKLTVRHPEDRPFLKGNYIFLPSIHFQVRAFSFRKSTNWTFAPVNMVEPTRFKNIPVVKLDSISPY